MHLSTLHKTYIFFLKIEISVKETFFFQPVDYIDDKIKLS